jgi:hypothetical protein
MAKRAVKVDDKTTGAAAADAAEGSYIKKQDI